MRVSSMSAIMASVITLALASPVAAQSLTNGNFADGLNGWTYDRPAGSGADGYAYVTENLTITNGNFVDPDDAPLPVAITAPTAQNSWFAYVVADENGMTNILKQSFTLGVGQAISIYAAFASSDSSNGDPQFNDDAYISVSNGAGSTLLTWSKSVLGDLMGQPGTDAEGTLTAVTTGWQLLTSAAATAAGTYTLEVGVRNVGDSGALAFPVNTPSYVLVADARISAVPGPVVGAGLPILFGLAAAGWRLRRRT